MNKKITFNDIAKKQTFLKQLSLDISIILIL